VKRRPRLLDLFSGAGGAAIEARFWKYVDRRGPDECWEWTGSRRATGYGQLNVARVPEKAHRLSFLIAFGWLPETVMHKCDNPPCVNPRHLFGGTQAENLADCAAKGRYARQLQPPVKATILALAECGLSQRAIARQTNVSRRSVGRVLAGGGDVSA
jgi:hypothetical protein